jgi:hypothetical protein
VTVIGTSIVFVMPEATPLRVIVRAPLGVLDEVATLNVDVDRVVGGVNVAVD